MEEEMEHSGADWDLALVDVDGVGLADDQLDRANRTDNGPDPKDPDIDDDIDFENDPVDDEDISDLMM